MVDFNNSKKAFADKSNFDLNRAYILFKTISNPLISSILTASVKFALFLRLPISPIIKATIYKHFCGGETIIDSKETINKLWKSSIGTILDYSAEGKEKEQDLFQPITIADYFFMKSKLFAQNNLQKDEHQLFNSLFEIMLSSLSNPDLLVYLYADVSRLQQNIKKRGRVFEQEITNEYLQNIQDRYLDYLRKQTHFPVLLLDVSNVDFKEDEKVYFRIKELLKTPYKIGVHQVNLSEPML